MKKEKFIGNSIAQNKPERFITDKKLFVIAHDGLEDEIPDYPSDEAAPSTYEEAEYAVASGLLSGNDRSYGEA